MRDWFLRFAGSGGVRFPIPGTSGVNFPTRAVSVPNVHPLRGNADAEATPVLADGTLYLSGPFQRVNGLPTPSLVRLNLGPLAPALRDSKLAENQLAATLHGLPGGVYPVEASADLEHWEPAGEVRLEGFDTRTPLTVPTGEGSRFFRVKSPGQ